MNRFIFLLQNNFQGLIELSIQLNNLSELEFSYKLFKITDNLPNSIKHSLINNTVNKTVVNSISSKQLMMSNKLLLGESTTLYTELLSLIESNKSNQNYICVNLPRLNTYLKLDQLILLTSFLGQYINSYDIIKLNLSNSNDSQDIVKDRLFQEVKKPQKQTKKSEDVLSLIDIDNQTDLLDNHKEIELSEIKVTIGRKLLREVLQISQTNSLISLYISKLILSDLERGYNNNISFENTFKFNNTKTNETILTINMIPLLKNNDIISQSHINEIIQVLETIKINRDEILGKLNLLVKYFNHIINKYIIGELKSGLSKREIIDHILLPIKAIQLLIFIYGFKVSSKVNYSLLSNGKIGNLVCWMNNNIINYICHKNGFEFESGFINICFNYCDEFDSIIDNVSYDDCLFEAISKYEYLISTDESIFIEHVFNDVSISLDDECKCKKSYYNIMSSLCLDKGKILDIDLIIKYSNNSNSLINYRDLLDEIDTSIKLQLNTNRIITKEYYHILRLSSIPSNMTMEIVNIDNDVNDIILRYGDVIINDMFRSIIVEDLHKTSISTLYLLDMFILSHMPNDNYTIEVVLFILYRVIIPYIVDMFGVTKFVDYLV